MLQEYKQHIISQFPFLLESRILIAVSGGVDSMVLLQKVILILMLLFAVFYIKKKDVTFHFQ